VKTIAAVVFLGVMGVFALTVDDDTAGSAKAGDCVQTTGSDYDPEITVVKCSSKKATDKVAERHDGDYQCDRNKYASYQETSRSRRLHRTRVDFTLCLSPLKKR